MNNIANTVRIFRVFPRDFADEYFHLHALPGTSLAAACEAYIHDANDEVDASGYELVAAELDEARREIAPWVQDADSTLFVDTYMRVQWYLPDDLVAAEAEANLL